MNMFGNVKIWLRLVVGISVMLMLAWAGIVWLVAAQQAEMGIKQARDFSASVNQMTIAAMTGMMITGNIAERAVYLDQIQNFDDATITALGNEMTQQVSSASLQSTTAATSASVTVAPGIHDPSWNTATWPPTPL